MHGALLSFIMTRSGLTRWATLTSNSIQPPTVLATDSSLYQRSVDRYFIDPNSFTYTYTSPNLITATRALFVRKSGRSAPVAVVGVQFDHSKWARRFFDIAETCIEQRPCTSTCSSEDFDCYVLDENGYVLVSEEDKETGLFFGTVNAMVMEMLVNSDVYKRLRVYDYQGVCGAGGGGEVQYSSGRLLQGPGYLVGWVWARAVQLFEWYMFGGEGEFFFKFQIFPPLLKKNFKFHSNLRQPGTSTKLHPALHSRVRPVQLRGELQHVEL